MVSIMTDPNDLLDAAAPAADQSHRAVGRAPVRARRPRKVTAARREEILHAAMATFGAKGYYNGSLAEVAEQVGMTHAGVLHHFGSKDQLLIEVLEYRDRADVENLEGKRTPTGLDLFRHLTATARLNASRPGIVQTYTVLSAESVTDDHPGKDWFRSRYEVLRTLLAESLALVCDRSDPPTEAEIGSAAASILAVMDGLQIQWLLDPETVDLAQSTAFAIEAIVAAVVRGHEHPPIL